MSLASDAMYAIVRQICDPPYAGPELPTNQDMMDAVIAYEVEQRHEQVGWEPPRPGAYSGMHLMTLRVTYGTPDIRGSRYREYTMSFKYLAPEHLYQAMGNTLCKCQDSVLREMKEFGWLK